MISPLLLALMLTATPDADVRGAIEKAIPLLERGAKGSMEQRKQCFTCHNQGVPVMALVEAENRGFRIDRDHIQAQLRFTAEFLGRNKDEYLKGKGQGGQVDTAGYALWQLSEAGWKPDATTAAVTEYLLQYQMDRDHWKSSSKRPPSEQSSFTTTFVALRGLKSFATPERDQRIEMRLEQVAEWLQETRPEDTEDMVFRLRSLPLVDAEPEEIQRAARALLREQRKDGGWSQLPDGESDPYATATALVALHEAAGEPIDSEAYKRGVQYLLKSQKEDGSWHVKTRSKPFQTYFESGYPHGKDQFISIAAAGWAVKALALTLPEVLPEPRGK